VRIGADLADDAEFGKAREQRLLDGSALADQGQRLGVLEPLGEHVDVLGVVVPDRDVVAGGLAEGGERFHHILIVVEYRDVHNESRIVRRTPFKTSARCSTYHKLRRTESYDDPTV
jgi:hypothetical protein